MGFLIIADYDSLGAEALGQHRLVGVDAEDSNLVTSSGQSTPLSLLPPTRTGLPFSLGWCSTETDTKKESRSMWTTVRWDEPVCNTIITDDSNIDQDLT